jgi:hypothetical protein
MKRLTKVLSKGFILLLFNMLVSSSLVAKEGELSVKDFGAMPNDGKDDSKAILAAIENAKSKGIGKVTFEAGVYEFKGLPGWERTERKRSCYLTVKDLSNLELSGKADSKGIPTTKFLKDNDLKECQPMIMSIENSSNITVRNIVVDMAPYYYSAGKITGIKGDEVTIEVFPDHPLIDGQKAFIMGLYDLKARKARVVRLTWDSNLPQWHLVGNEKERKMTINHPSLAQAAKTGEGVFWFQGNYTGSLLNFAHINGLLLENVSVLNGHGFPITCNFCRDITYRNVNIKPVGNRIATACRDGFKIYCGGGKVLMDGVHVEGCLGDDGQNIHGTWLAVLKKASANSLTTYESSMPCLTPGKEVVLLDDLFRPAWKSRVESCSAQGREMTITFTDPVPDWVHEKTPIEPHEWLPESLHITNCVYRTTGRFGIILKASNALIENTLFENNVAGIQMGAEWSWGYWLESMNPQHVEIKNCTFRDNHLDMRFGGKKMDMSINIASWTNPLKLGVPSDVLSGLINDIRIHDNLFEDETLCVSLQNCGNVWFWNNTLKNCGKDLLINEKTAVNVFRSAPDKVK